MIDSHDRSGWFGASDTARIMGSWETKTFALYWMEKLGLYQNNYESPAMNAGTHWEGRILDHLGILKRNRQIKIPKYCLRVNLDGEDKESICEVKTCKKPFAVSKAYWQQAQVQIFASGKPVFIAAYQLKPEDYQNYFLPIDPARLSLHGILYDEKWVVNEYLPKLYQLALCLKKGKSPWQKLSAN